MNMRINEPKKYRIVVYEIGSGKSATSTICQDKRWTDHMSLMQLIVSALSKG